MKREEIFHYLVLCCLLLGGIGAFYVARTNPGTQLGIGIITSVSYVVWGMIHHALKRDLHRKIVVEYLLMGMIAIVLLATILKS